MKHITETMQRIKSKQSISTERFFRNNIDIFLRYFKSIQDYERLLNEHSFAKMREIIKENSVFNFDAWAKQIKE
jgi:hypothetical protein